MPSGGIRVICRRAARVIVVPIIVSLVLSACGSHAASSTTASPGSDWQALPCGLPVGLRAIATDPSAHTSWILTSSPANGLVLSKVPSDGIGQMASRPLHLSRQGVSEIGIAVGSDGGVWLSLGSQVARYSETSGQLTSWKVPAASLSTNQFGGAAATAARADGVVEVAIPGARALQLLEPRTGRWSLGARLPLPVADQPKLVIDPSGTSHLTVWDARTKKRRTATVTSTASVVVRAPADASDTDSAVEDSKGAVYTWHPVKGGVVVTRTQASGRHADYMFAFSPLSLLSSDGKAPVGGLPGTAFADARVQGLLVDGKDRLVLITGMDGSEGSYSCAYMLRTG